MKSLMDDVCLGLKRGIMLFKPEKDGETHIIFSEEEIEIIKKNKKIILDAHAASHFANNLMKLIWFTKINIKDKKIRNQQSQSPEVKIPDDKNK